MFQAFYNGLSGMNASSKALDIVSDNVSNMQTPGFKAKDVFMQNVDTPTKGLGSQVSDVLQRYTQGEVSQTANPTDLFIDGRGLFALQDEDNRYFTRAGLLRMNDDNVLVDKLSGFEIIAFGNDDQLGKVDISDKLSISAVPTTEISLRGEVSIDDGEAAIEKMGYVAKDGSYRYLNAIAKRIDDSEKWEVSIIDSRDNEVGSGEISFESNGTLKAGSNKVALVLSDEQSITLSFGEAGSLSGVILGQPGQSSSIKMVSENGKTESPYNDILIDEKGKITLTYGNGEEKTIGNLALAKVGSYEKFTTHSGHLLVCTEEVPSLVKIGEGIDANLVSGALELSNVDLAREFGDMMVIQRSYQASSRVMTVANQLVEQLYGGSGG
ncbi:flagellar hook-basal body complex protein [Vibrio lentus]|uniref:flagellar hook-basal body complex protein n=1 Tax=Vibrio lentus TaxID=136468 RepID=UPI0024784D0B|nr:flagellar hook-basal body complex protein [Vibrio lentus]WGS63069.1 flagellar hook-basal body complex protein [Vibrio lentus]